MDKEKTVKKVTYRFSPVSVIFLIIVLLPFFNGIFDFYTPLKLKEKRRVAKKPLILKTGFKKYLSDYSKYFNDNFTFRSHLIFLNNYLRVKLFNVSPVDRVMIGKKGWLFIKKLRENDVEMDYSRSIDRFSKEELELWRRIFDERFKWLDSRGIKMFIFLVPNKSTIYPEYLPDRIRGVTSQVRTDQIIKYFEDHAMAKIVDLRSKLLAEKKRVRVYYKTDSHWNWYGTYVGYAEVMRQLSMFFKDVEILPFDFFVRKKILFSKGGDLAAMLSLQNTIFKEDFFRLFPGPGVKIRRSVMKKFYRKNVNTEVSLCETGELPKTIMIHDSFGLRLRKMMSPHFKKIIYLRDWGFNIFPDLIEREKPKIVIYEIAERFLHNFLLKNPEQILN